MLYDVINVMNGQLLTGTPVTKEQLAQLNLTEEMRVVKTHQALYRYPRLTAHLICESLGYFTPLSASRAIEAVMTGDAFYCEWYSSMMPRRDGGYSRIQYKIKMLEITEEAVRQAFRRRHTHQGFMADYQHGLALVQHVQKRGEPAHMLASWM